MGAFGEEGVIIELNRIPMVKIGRAASNSSRKVTQTADKNLSRLATRKRRASNTQIDPGCVGIDRFQALIIVYSFMVATNTDGIHEAWREDVCFLQRNELSRRQRGELNVIQSVRRRVGRFVEHVCAEQAVAIRDLVVDPSGKKVFVDDLLADKGEFSGVSVPKNRAIGQMVKSEVLRRRWIYGDLSCRAGITWVRARQGRNALRLPDAFVIGEEECVVPHDRSANRCAKLIPLERRNGKRAVIEVILGVQLAVAKKLVHTAVKLICPRARNGVDHSSG